MEKTDLLLRLLARHSFSQTVQPEHTLMGEAAGTIEILQGDLEEAHAAVPKWRDIESAPADTAVLVYIPAARRSVHRVVTGFYGINALGTRMWIVNGHFAFEIGQPTMWMPLPEPPEHQPDNDEEDNESGQAS